MKPSTLRFISVAGAIGWVIFFATQLLIGKYLVAALCVIPAIALARVAKRAARRVTESW